MLRVSFSPAPVCVEVDCWNRCFSTPPWAEKTPLLLLLLLLLFKAQARIPPGLRKVLPKGGVVFSFSRSSFRCFVVSSFRRAVLVLFVSILCCRFLVRRFGVFSFRCSVDRCVVVESFTEWVVMSSPRSSFRFL